MKTLFRCTAMAFSMFSALPAPQVEWKKENMKYMLCALPLVGVVIGAALVLWQLVCAALGFGTVLYAAGMSLLPLLLSGGIHMDGFCDTADALSSHAPAPRKREILKDSHAGAFAILYAAAWLLACFALCTEVPPTLRGALLLGLVQVLSRALGALAGVAFPGSGSTGLLASFRDGAAKSAAGILVIWCLAALAGLLVLAPLPGAVCAAAALACLWYLYRMSRREFGGMSGDLAGYLISLSQPVLLFCFLLTERMVSLWF